MKIKLLIITTLIFLSNSIALGLPRDFDAYVTPGNIELQVIDPLGNTSGYEPSDGSTFCNIPNTMYVLGGEPNSIENSYHIVMGNMVSNKQHINNGNYKIKIFGASTVENMTLYFKVFYQNMIGAKIMTEHTSIIYPNITWVYEITIPNVPPTTKNVPLIKVANPQDLITDIKAAGQLNYIGNKQFVSEIIKKAEAVSLSKTDQKKEYTELLNEITEKYNKPEDDEFVKQEAYTVLREDLEYIISHL